MTGRREIIQFYTRIFKKSLEEIKLLSPFFQ
jgi:hypothetical protein